MRVYRVGITGHRPDRFKDVDLAISICDKLVADIQYQYGDSGELCFNLGGCIGADQWVGDACIKYGVNFHLYLPFPIDVQAKYWYDYQKENLVRQADACSGMTVVGDSYQIANYFVRDKMIVDNSDFMVCLWEGCTQGGTFQTIKYAVKQSKIVLNALTNMSLVSKSQLFPKKIHG